MMAKPFIIAALFFIFSHAVYSQGDVSRLDSLAGNMIRQLRESDQETIDIVTDKTIYQAGETLWFRAFVLGAISQKINTRSKVLYVELIDTSDSVLAVSLLNPMFQLLEGKFKLPDTLPSGYYWLRGYTGNMLASDSTNIFFKAVAVLNKRSSDLSWMLRGADTKKSSAKPENVSIRLIPEGGTLITGAPNLMLLSALDQNQHPVPLTGELRDQRDTLLFPIHTNTEGWGSFTIEPSRFRHYSAWFNYNGERLQIPFPRYNFSAAQLAVFPGQPRKVRVLLEDSIFKKNYTTYLLGISRDSLCFASIGQGNYVINLPEDKFPPGPGRLLLYSKDGILLSSRPVYIDKKEPIVSIQTNKPAYSARELVALDVAIEDSRHQPILSSLSISVTDSSYNPLADSVSALHSHAAADTSRSLAIDGPVLANEINLLLAQDSATKRVLSGKEIRKQEDSLFYVKGLVLNRKGLPAPNKLVRLIVNAASTVLFADTTDAGGRFSFALNAFLDSTLLYLQPLSIRGNHEDLSVVLDQPEMPTISSPSNRKHAFPFSSKTMKEVVIRIVDTTIIGTGKEWLKPVTVKRKKAKPVNYDESKRVSPFSTLIPPEKLGQGFATVANAILSTPGVRLSQGYLIIGGVSSTRSVSASDEPMVVVDGISYDTVTLKSLGVMGASPVLNFLNTLTASSIDFIEILRGGEAAIYGVRGGNGVIVIHTLSRNRENNMTDKTLNKIYAKGFQVPASFFIPNYEDAASLRNTTKDERTTIYWKGNIVTDENGKVHIRFFTSDLTTTYRVTVSGVTINGDRIYRQYFFRNN